MPATNPEPRVTVEAHRLVKVAGVDGRPALELLNVNGEVKVALLPKQGQRRAPVRLVDLAEAVEALAG